jgi:hypothetical protein
MVDRATALRLATIGGVATMLIPILWSRLYLPSLSQIVITSLVVLDRDAASTHFRALLRILGCPGRRRIRPFDDPIWNRFVIDLVRYAGRGYLPSLPFTP